MSRLESRPEQPGSPLERPDFSVIPVVWDLSPLLPGGDNDPLIATEQAMIAQHTRQFVEKWKPRADYLEDPKMLKEALDDFAEWKGEHGAIGKAGYYIGLRREQDNDDAEL